MIPFLAASGAVARDGADGKHEQSGGTFERGSCRTFRDITACLKFFFAAGGVLLIRKFLQCCKKFFTTEDTEDTEDTEKIWIVFSVSSVLSVVVFGLWLRYFM